MKPSELALIVGLLVACAAVLGLATQLYRERRNHNRLVNSSQVPRQVLNPLAPSSQTSPNDVRPAAFSLSRPEAIRFERTTGRSSFEVRIPSKKYMEAHSWKKLELSEQSRTWLAPFWKALLRPLRFLFSRNLLLHKHFALSLKAQGS
jgi:hypothetical protein